MFHLCTCLIRVYNVKQTLIFSQLRKVHNEPERYLYGSLIPVVEDFKFLGVLFDRKLSVIPHIKYCFCADLTGTLVAICHVAICHDNRYVLMVKNSKLFFSETTRPTALMFGMWQWLMVLYIICVNRAPGAKFGHASGVDI